MRNAWVILACLAAVACKRSEGPRSAPAPHEEPVKVEPPKTDAAPADKDPENENIVFKLNGPAVDVKTLCAKHEQFRAEDGPCTISPLLQKVKKESLDKTGFAAVQLVTFGDYCSTAILTDKGWFLDGGPDVLVCKDHYEIHGIKVEVFEDSILTMEASATITVRDQGGPLDTEATFLSVCLMRDAVPACTDWFAMTCGDEAICPEGPSAFTWKIDKGELVLGGDPSQLHQSLNRRSKLR